MDYKYIKTKDSYGLLSAYGRGLCGSRILKGTAKCVKVCFKDVSIENNIMYNNLICFKLHESLLDYHGNVYEMNDNSVVYLIKDCVLKSEISAPLYPLENTENKISKYKTYLMVDGSGFTKIGKAIDPYKREKTLQSEKPTILLLAITEIDVEKELHNKYEIKRYRGEWFNLSKKDIKTIIDEYKFSILE